MPNTYLTVAFKEKDAVKALGARWDGDARQWYVPPGLDIALFNKWLPADERATSPAGRDLASAATTGDVVVQGRGISLSRLLSGVAKAVSDAYAAGVWTTAEVVRASLRDGHIYLELSERTSDGRVVAKANAAIWARTAERIVPEFERATGAVLGAGIKLMVRARPMFKPQFGFSLEIDGLDPSYTLGDLEAKKREIRERLKREGLFGLNKQLEPPWDFRHVLVVAPEAAAGLGDFAAEAERLQRHGVCEFTYVHSRFQGEGAAAEILKELRRGVSRPDLAGRLDAVIIIRGGGAVNDLAWLNDYDLARFICECDYPVLVGIGHERDSTLLDEVAHRSFDTPSKVVAGIEQHVLRRTREARSAFDAVLTRASRDIGLLDRSITGLEREVKTSAAAALADAKQACSNLLGTLRVESVRTLHRADRQTRDHYRDVRAGALEHIAAAKVQVPAAIGDVRTGAFAALRTARRDLGHLMPTLLQRASADAAQMSGATERIFDAVVERAGNTVAAASAGSEALMREITGQGPQKTLGRGFALVKTPGGETVTNAERAGQVRDIQIVFSDGVATAAVQNIQPSDGNVLGSSDGAR